MRAPGEWIRPWADATAGGGKRQSHQDGRGGELGGREAPRSAEVPLAARVDLRGERTRCAGELRLYRWLHKLNLTPQQKNGTYAVPHPTHIHPCIAEMGDRTERPCTVPCRWRLLQRQLFS